MISVVVRAIEQSRTQQHSSNGKSAKCTHQINATHKCTVPISLSLVTPLLARRRWYTQPAGAHTTRLSRGRLRTGQHRKVWLSPHPRTWLARSSIHVTPHYHAHTTRAAAPTPLAAARTDGARWGESRWATTSVAALRLGKGKEGKQCCTAPPRRRHRHTAQGERHSDGAGGPTRWPPPQGTDFCS